MRVVCIDNGPMRNSDGFIHDAPQLIEGDVYTVTEIIFCGYKLKEASVTPPRVAFNPNRFIPLSEINETEFNRNYQTETI